MLIVLLPLPFSDISLCFFNTIVFFNCVDGAELKDTKHLNFIFFSKISTRFIGNEYRMDANSIHVRSQSLLVIANSQSASSLCRMKCSTFCSIKFKIKKIKSTLGSRYYAEACNKWRGPSRRLSVWATWKCRGGDEP